MPSKEEIEEVKKFINNILLKHDWFDNAYYLAANAKTLIMYIEQLETREQKLIEKLERNIKENQINYKTNTDGLEDYWRGCIDIETEILKILKGENDE